MATTSTRKTTSAAKATATETAPEATPAEGATDEAAKAPGTDPAPAPAAPAPAPAEGATDEVPTTDPTPPTVDTVKDKKPNGSTDGLFGALVKSAKVVKSMPTGTRSGSSRVNPFAALVKESFDTKEPRELAPIDAKDQDRVVGAIRRGAASNGLGVNVVPVLNEDGKVVITLQGKQKG